ncbi:MAG: fluoride efflux transporter CrcB [Micromonosporaceae bacterium]|nr:fluoride efflux transporter CrcB [Micromonosporaceae bacterium]
MTPLLVALGAAVGAPLRYLVDRLVQSRHDSLFPWGTFAVNVAGSFLLGLVALVGSRAGIALLGTGFCGALTTYSTFGYETVRLVQERSRLLAMLNVVASIAAGLGAAYLGTLVAQVAFGIAPL